MWTSHEPEAVQNFWVMNILVQVFQCLYLMDLQQRHGMYGKGGFLTGLVSLAGEIQFHWGN